MVLELLILNAVLFLILCALPEREGTRPEHGRRRARAVLRETGAAHRSLGRVTLDGARSARSRVGIGELSDLPPVPRLATVGAGLLLVAGGAFVLAGDAAPGSSAASGLSPSHVSKCTSPDPEPSPAGDLDELREFSVHGVSVEMTPTRDVRVHTGL